ncbi:ABC transporter ATP-binding protein [Lactobacillus helsingborgensis]|uniref:ABC transporter ATP-binding protein n=1 Tax=Lactobacillus helsingborgensis TaxID=1218494 RepID=UPI0022646ED6|nr:ABC transporter ATP-binding protein [Lactobacillus helsingborgensis]MEB3365325.1 ABC transporter ATP-binding protein [Lactobacillus sp. R2/2]UZX30696.1 ABC transporter ATP-binding protein [Lactobacillus helsingborgensis]
MENLLEIRDLTYKKNLKTILDNINLNLQPGKIVALLGENGAGKTTLMRIISGMAKNYHGTVTISGENMIAERKAHLSFTDGLTGFANSTKIKEIVKFYKIIYQDFDQNQFEQLRQFMKLDSEMRLSEMSKGMREKLIIALAFSRKADLYLLDEPFSGIDAMARKKIINSIILWKPENSTILVSDHFVNEIASMLDEIVIIKDKTIYTHKSTEEIREHHKSVEDYYEGLYDAEEE